MSACFKGVGGQLKLYYSKRCVWAITKGVIIVAVGAGEVAIHFLRFFACLARMRSLTVSHR